jgi:signal transduction histidine kinase
MTRMIKEDPAPDYSSRLPGLREALMTEEGLRHISRLVTIGELALCFSHEVRTPLTCLTGHALMAQRAVPEDDPLRFHLDSVYRSSLRMKGMIDTMLNFGRIREKTSDRCAPDELIHEALRVADPYFEKLKGPRIVVQVDVERGCPRVAVDRWEMVHVLVNLFNNAADAMAQSPERVLTISAHAEANENVRFAVGDTGSGISTENAGQVFTPFFTTKGERGNGLGLYIVRNTIEHHGGSITLQSGTGGTVFTICLPC